MPRLLDLFCGAGGSAMGYSRAGFDVVGIDIKIQPHYPFEGYQDDALAVLAKLNEGYQYAGYYLHDFDAIHASPPCQGYIQRNKNLVTKWPKLIEPVRWQLQETLKPYVIENVEGAPLHNPIRLCGTMFDLLVLRHRLFETNWGTTCNLKCNHWGTVADGDFAAVYAFGGKGHRRGRDADGNKLRDPGSAPGPDWSIAMGIDWMTKKEMAEAIPPAYAEYVGLQLVEYLRPITSPKHSHTSDSATLTSTA